MKNMLKVFMDVTFILFLCFAILLLSMLAGRFIPGLAQEPGRYVVRPLMLTAVVLSITGFLVFMLRTSIGEFSELLDKSAPDCADGENK